MPVEYDFHQADETIKFIEAVCYVPEGAHSRRPLILRDWQKSLIRDVYKINPKTGKRPVRHATLSIGRKNGKTALISALMIAHLCGPLAVQGGELSSFALTREQASMLFRYAAGMVRLSHRLADRLKIIDSRKQINDPVSGSHYTALSADAKSQLGRSPVVIFGDELGAFGQNRELYDALMTGQGAHENPLAWILSTQASTDEDVLSEIIDYSIENPDDESYYTRCYNLDKDDDPFLEANWYKANPALNDFLSLDDFRIMAQKAEAMPGGRSSFLNLRLNQRIDAVDCFLSRDIWEDTNHDRMPTFEDLRGMDVSVGIDLAKKRDLTAVVWMGEGEDGNIIIVPTFFLPKGAVSERQDADKVNYKKWIEMDLLIAPPGESMDYDFVAKLMVETADEYDLNVVTGGFDPWRRDEFDKAWIRAEAGDRFSEIKDFLPYYKHMSPAVDTFEKAAYEKTLWHGNHPILTWNVSNCVVIPDQYLNRVISKKKSFQKVDGAIATVMALQRLSLIEDDQSVSWWIG